MKGIIVISEVDERQKIFVEEYDILITPDLTRVEVVRVFPGTEKDPTCLIMHKKTDFEVDLSPLLEDLIITHIKTQSALNSHREAILRAMVKAEVEARMGEKIPD